MSATENQEKIPISSRNCIYKEEQLRILTYVYRRYDILIRNMQVE